MIAHTVIYGNLKTSLFTKSAATMNKLKKIMGNPHEKKRAHKKLYGNFSDYAKKLRNF